MTKANIDDITWLIKECGRYSFYVELGLIARFAKRPLRKVLYVAIAWVLYPVVMIGTIILAGIIDGTWPYRGN